MSNERIFKLTCPNCKKTTEVDIKTLRRIIGDPIDELLDFDPDPETMFECSCGKRNSLRELGYTGGEDR